MGGKGSGGVRPGAGRKSKAGFEVWLGGDAGKRQGSKRPSEPQVERFNPPLDLPELHRDVWERLAPHAFAARTLTKGTAAAFRDLCEAIVVRDGLLSRIHQDGYGSKDGKHPLLSDYRGMYQRVETGMMKFRLAPMGKPMVEERATPEDPFDEFDGAEQSADARNH